MKYRTVSVCIHFALGEVVLCSLALGYINPASAVGPRCYVRADAIGGSGTSWGDAYKSLQDALGNPACMEIWAAKGTYKPTIGMDRMVSFVLKSGVAIYGGFTATETMLSQRNWVANVTILSGDIGVSGNPE